MHGIMRQQKFIYFIAIVLSVILSTWGALRVAVINPDAICYLQSAQSIPLGFGFVTHLCDQSKWPFYSALIYGLVSISKWSYINAAHVLDGFFSLLSVVTFISIVRYFKNTPRILWFALIVIILAHEFNAVREYIVRDHGFWAFYLISILCLLYFFREFRFKLALGWGASLLIATLFRLEGLFFLLAMPFTCFFVGGHAFAARIKAFVKLNALTLAVIVLVTTWLLVQPKEHIAHLGRLSEVKFQLMHGVSVIVDRFQLGERVLAQQVLSQYAAHDANLIFFQLLLMWYTLSVIQNCSFIYAFLVIYAWVKKLLPRVGSSHLVVWGYVLVNVLVTATFLVENMFLSKRYLLALSLTLFIWTPFALEYLSQQWQARKWPLLLVLFLMVISSLGGILDFGYSKKYLRQGGEWASQHVPAQANLFSNDYHVLYYSNHFGNTVFSKAQEFSSLQALANDQWKQYDYIIVHTEKHEQEKNAVLIKQLGTPLQVFANKRGDAVMIYKIH